MAFGGRSETITICLPLSCSALKLKELFLGLFTASESTWMSSISSTSTLR